MVFSIESRRPHLLGLFVGLISGFPAFATADDLEDAARTVLQEAPAALCPDGILDPEARLQSLGGALSGFELASVRDRGDFGLWARREVRLEDAAQDLALVVRATRLSETLRRVVFETHGLSDGRPLVVALADGDCTVQHGRAIRYDADGPCRGTSALRAGFSRSLERSEPAQPAPASRRGPGWRDRRPTLTAA